MSSIDGDGREKAKETTGIKHVCLGKDEVIASSVLALDDFSSVSPADTVLLLTLSHFCLLACIRNMLEPFYTDGNLKYCYVMDVFTTVLIVGVNFLIVCPCTEGWYF